MKWDFLHESAHVAAPLLLGATISTLYDGVTTSGRIVEVEAYTESDPASHAFVGPTVRNQVMFGPAGHAYVYISYGMHYCMNIVTGREGSGEGVLIRALEPKKGIETMWQRRYDDSMPILPARARLFNLTNGPGKLTRALGVTMSASDSDLLHPNSAIKIELPTEREQLEIFTSRRIGISRGVDTQWRWYLQSPWVSKAPGKVPLTDYVA